MNTPDLYKLFKENPNICIDSRQATDKSIFFALKGSNTDGNKYAEQALSKCSYAVVDDESIVKDDRYILVEDVLEKLQHLAKYHRKRLGIPIIAITGTNGKTTTKELTARVLSKKYNIGSTKGNLNNHIGVPLTLLSFTNDMEMGVVEMGANHPGEIKALCKIAAPDYGLITNVGKAHLEGFGSLDGVIKTKAELYNYLYDNDGVAFINYDNEILEDMRPPHSVIYYGTKGFTHCQGRIENNDSLFLSLRWIVTDDVIETHGEVDWNRDGKLINTKLYGDYNFENVLAAICIGNNFNVNDKDIKDAIESYTPKNNRSEIIDTKRKNTLIIDSYNANPFSMDVAVNTFNKQKIDNKILILGDMLELGGVASREHAILLGKLKQLDVEKVFLIGELFYKNKFDSDTITFFKDTEDAIENISKQNLTNKNILIKGSRCMHLEKLFNIL